jgi:hypothetical protein
MRAKAIRPWKRMITAVSLAAGLYMVQAPSAFAHVEECIINWDNRFALSNILQQARATFVVPTTFDQNGQLTACQTTGNSAQNNLNCWQYQHPCGHGRISVWDQYYRHFHLGFEDESISSCFIDGGFGRMIDNRCVAPDWAGEPRIATSHAGDAWWEILLLAPNGDLKTFDLETIAVGGTTPIQMWFRKVDGSVWGWSELPAGANWDVSGSASGIVAVWVSAVAGNISPFTINDFSISAD